MALHIPPEIVNKLAFFEVSVENYFYDVEYDTEETRSYCKTRKEYANILNKATLIIKMHIGRFTLLGIPLLNPQNKSNILDELLRLRSDIIERTEGESEVVLESDDGIVKLNYRNESIEEAFRISLETPDREVPSQADITLIIREQMLKTIDALYEYAISARRAVNKFKARK